MKSLKNFIQGSLFEEDYLIRTLGSLGSSPDVALTELVANAWDAGATKVDITIPYELGKKLTIVDNGIGLSREEFYTRWMKLGYNRIKHQGRKVEFPEGINVQRLAYGRNGVGRHGMLCFNSEYKVITSRNGTKSMFQVTTRSEREPFVIKSEKFEEKKNTGTKLEVIVQKNLPEPEKILDVISARFLHDPNFIISINGNTVELEQHRGLIVSEEIEISDVKLIIHLIDSRKARKSTIYQGIAIWQDRRLVGEPSWAIGKEIVLDGRSQEAKRYSVVVETEGLSEYIKEDWTGFKRDKFLDPIFEKVNEVIQKMFSNIAKENIEDTTKKFREDYKQEYNELTPLAKHEFNEAIKHIATSRPTAKFESIELALETVLNLEKTRSGSQLLQKLSSLSTDDIEGLNTLLENWSVKDALVVLDEIDKRISIIEAIRKLSGDSTVDELRVLHPLVANARWIFGPEFDSPEFSSNNQLQTTVEKVFGKKIDKSVFQNHKKRPDIVFLNDSTFSITGTVAYNNKDEITSINRVIIIELKKGNSRLGRSERNQAVGYVEDFISSGTLLGNPYIHAFVVGKSFSEKIQPVQTIENENKVEVGKVQICLFSQIVDSSERRLFNLRKRLNERYEGVTGIELFQQQRVLGI